MNLYPTHFRENVQYMGKLYIPLIIRWYDFQVMNASDISYLENFCMTMSNDIHALFPNIDLYFVISAPMKRSDCVGTVLSKLNGHPAFNGAFQILKAWASGKDYSAFLGLSEEQENIVFSFQKRKRTLGFIAVDISLYQNIDEAKKHIHLMMSQFLETYSLHLRKPLEKGGNIYPQTKDELGTCYANLKSDIYSVLQLSRDGHYDTPMKLARQRCLETLTPQTSFHPEEFPFPIALDVINYTLETQILSAVSARHSSPILSQFHLSEKIVSCFEPENLYSWLTFAKYSQTMAWSGFSASQILGAAINTSTNPFIKAIGHMIAEMTNLPPVNEDHLPFGYNPFLADEINQIRHLRAIDETFEMVLIHAMEAESHIPLLRVANNQNDALTKGKISGWCANGLHAAARAYIGAKDRGIPPIQAARLEFQSAKLQANWSVLLLLGEHIISLYRTGEQIDFKSILQWAKETPDSKFVQESINITLSDPKFIKSAATLDRPLPQDKGPFQTEEERNIPPPNSERLPTDSRIFLFEDDR